MDGIPFELDSVDLVAEFAQLKTQVDTVKPKTKLRKSRTELTPTECAAKSTVRSLNRDDDDVEENTCLKLLTDFLHNDYELALELPASLTARQRRYLHEMAEKQANLKHYSVGSDQNRRLVLEKSARPAQPATESVPETSCERGNDELCDTETEKSTLEMETKVTTRSRKKKVKKKKANKENEESEDVVLMERARQEAAECPLEGCKRSVGLVSVECRFCQRPFCVSHSQAEVHGCGSAAKKEAKQRFVKKHFDETRTANSARKETTEQRQNRLRDKLKGELRHMEMERQRKGQKTHK